MLVKYSSAFLCFFYLLAGSSFTAEVPWTVSVKSKEVSQGGVLAVSVLGEDMAGVRALVRNRELSFFAGQDGSFVLLLGVDLEDKPGPMEISIKGLKKSGEKKESLLTLQIKEKTFPQENISVPATFDRIDEATRKRIEREQAKLAALWALSTPRRLWDGSFVTPVFGGVTSPFGLRRVVNGLPRTPHGGVDLKASLGTEVVASNHGQVVLREEFFFSGKSIVLDHGAGLYTMYFHLADLRAEKNSLVRKGDLIGLAGMTGRVTGPHLHWGVRLNGARVDPFELLEAAGNRQKAEGTRQ